MLCELDEHDESENHTATRVEASIQLQPDPTAPLPQDAAGNDITHDIDGNPVVPLVEVEVQATVTYRWV